MTASKLSFVVGLLPLLLLPAIVKGSDTPCWGQSGYCTYNACSSGFYKQSGLCDGPANRQCCVPRGTTGGDSECQVRNGVCKYTSSSCSGYFQSGLCAGPADRQCCL